MAVLVGLLLATNLPAWKSMYQAWMSDPDNSHGLLVPIFAGVLWWLRAHDHPESVSDQSGLSFFIGVALIMLATAANYAGIYTRTFTLEAISIVPLAGGIILCCGGWRWARDAWPSVLFLVFMIPLPRHIGNQLAGALQQIATAGSTFLLQVLGLPAVAEGNLIYLTDSTLGVAEACSGIRMLMSFFALTTAICILVDRPWWQKIVIWLSAPAIAIVANVLRITSTGIAYEYGSERTAQMIFHDLAGWLMMVVGLALLWIELATLSKINPKVDHVDLPLMQKT